MQPAPGAWSPEGLTLLAFPNVALVALVAQYLLGDLLDELEHLLRHRVLELLSPVFETIPWLVRHIITSCANSLPRTSNRSSTAL